MRLRLLDPLYVRALRAGEWASDVQGEELGVAANRGERRSELVADDGDELSLLSARPLGAETGRLGGPVPEANSGR